MSHSEFITPSTAYKALSQAEANSISSGKSVEISPGYAYKPHSEKQGGILITNDMRVP